MIKAACHIHSDWSYDGSWSLERLATAFSKRGYRVLFMTEHDRGFTAERLVRYRAACAQASSDKLLVVPGIEYSDPQNIIHILTWGDLPFLGENQPTSSLLRAVREANGIAVLAHPARKNAWQLFDHGWIDSLLGIELWNRKADGWAPSEPASRLRNGSPQPFMVGLDFHTGRQFFPLALKLDVQGEVSEFSAVEAIRAGRFTSTALGIEVDCWMKRSSARACLLQLERWRKKLVKYLK